MLKLFSAGIRTLLQSLPHIEDKGEHYLCTQCDVVIKKNTGEAVPKTKQRFDRHSQTKNHRSKQSKQPISAFFSSSNSSHCSTQCVSRQGNPLLIDLDKDESHLEPEVQPEVNMLFDTSTGCDIQTQTDFEENLAETREFYTQTEVKTRDFSTETEVETAEFYTQTEVESILVS